MPAHIHNQPQPQGTKLPNCTDYAISIKISMKSDYKLCQQLHKFTVKKVTAIQKLNTHRCTEPCTHHDNIRLRAKHFASRVAEICKLC